MPAPTLAVVNPASSHGRTAGRWPAVFPLLEAALGPVDVEWTRGPRDAERIAREAALAGVSTLVAAGGDGTTREVVAGLLSSGLSHRVRVAPLPLGSGGDFLRTIGLPTDLTAAVAALAHGHVRSVDAGRAVFQDGGGREASSWFVNIASFGISGLITALVNRSGKRLGGRMAFLMGTVRGIARYRPEPVRIRVDGELVHDGPLVLATAASGRFFGGGMHVAPEAKPDDGAFDCVVVPELSRGRLLRRLPLIYSGRHLGVDGTLLRRGARVEAHAEPGRVHLELDGEPLGTLPAAFEVVPGAVRILGGSG